jgi:uncharacterized protein YneR
MKLGLEIVLVALYPEKHIFDWGKANMKLTVTGKAVTCLQEEWGFEEAKFVRVYVRYVGGDGDPYALGILKEESVPVDRAIRTEIQEIIFFIEEKDQWYLQEKDLIIDAQGVDIRFVLDGPSVGE